MSERMLKLWKINEYREKRLESIFKSLKLKPNKPEKVLNNLLNLMLPNEYKYIGDGQIIIGGFNPDFINVNGQKKIIEMFGDYWHNREDTKERDTKRLETYKKYGYETLVIWENELKNIYEVTEKIISFNKNSNND
jgi:very-short-patch-repair endonuclease